MTEDLRPGFVIKEAVREAVENGWDVAEAVQVALVQLEIGRPRNPRGDDNEGRGDGHDSYDFGYDTSDRDDALF